MKRYTSLNELVREILNCDAQYENPTYYFFTDGGPKGKDWKKHYLCVPSFGDMQNHKVRITIKNTGTEFVVSKKNFCRISEENRSLVKEFVKQVNQWSQKEQ